MGEEGRGQGAWEPLTESHHGKATGLFSHWATVSHKVRNSLGLPQDGPKMQVKKIKKWNHNSGNNELRREKAHSWQTGYVPGTSLASSSASLMSRTPVAVGSHLEDCQRRWRHSWDVLSHTWPEAKASLSEFKAPALPPTPSGGVHDSESTTLKILVSC